MNMKATAVLLRYLLILLSVTLVVQYSLCRKRESFVCSSPSYCASLDREGVCSLDYSHFVLESLKEEVAVSCDEETKN